MIVRCSLIGLVCKLAFTEELNSRDLSGRKFRCYFVADLDTAQAENLGTAWVEKLGLCTAWVGDLDNTYSDLSTA